MRLVPVSAVLLVLSLAGCGGSGGVGSLDGGDGALGPAVVGFAASPATVVAGKPTEVIWAWGYAPLPSQAPTCTVDHGVGPVTRGAATTVTIAADTTFTLTCTSTGGTGTAQVTLHATPAPVAPVIASFTAAPSAVTSGAATAVTWTWTYAATPVPAPTCAIDHGVGTLASGAASSVTLSADTTFTLTCTSTAGTDSAQVTVTVTPPTQVPQLASFVGVPGTVVDGVPTTVRWTWTYLRTPVPTPTCSIDHGVGTMTSGGTSTITLSAATTFTVTCTSSAGTGAASFPIAVVPQVAPQLATFTATPAPAPTEVPTVVTWRWTFASPPQPAPTCTVSPAAGATYSNLSATATLSLASDTVFTLTCASAAGSDARQLTIGTRPPWVLRDAGADTFHSCAIDPDGGAWCWGAAGLLGDILGTASRIPFAVRGVTGPVTGAVAVAAGQFHTCAVIQDGTVQCWGDDSKGQLGDDRASADRTPVTVTGISTAAPVIAAGWNHTCVALAEGGVRCWGEGTDGQLGRGAWGDSWVPVAVSGITARVVSLAAGKAHTCAALEDGSVWCWGSNGYGELGIGTTSPTYSYAPVATAITSGATAVSAGLQSSCALVSGGVRCWGVNGSGQLGDGTRTARSAPVPATGLTSGVVDVQIGDGHACAVLAGGAVKCWGDNSYGQLGDGTTSGHLTAAAVPALGSGVARVRLGGNDSCALLTAGGMMCWGVNAEGILGDGTTTTRTVPTWVSGL